MKKMLLGIVGLLLIGGLTGGVIFLSQRQQATSPVPSSPDKATTKIEPSKTLKDYADPSGFSLQYPDDISILAKEASDAATYADVDFSSKKVGGSVNVHIADSKLKSLNDWLKGQEADDKSVKDATLSGMKAKEVIGSDGVTLAALDQGVLFTITTNFKENKDFWQSVYSTLSSSFAFSSSAQSSASSGSSDSSNSSDVIFEGEEVVE